MIRLPWWSAIAVLVAGMAVGIAVVSLAPVAQGAGPTVPGPGSALPRPRELITFAASEQEPVATPDLLPAGVPAVYAFYNIPEVSAGGIPTASWRAGGKPIGRIPPGDVRAEPTHPGHGSVVLRAPDGRLGAGVYELELQTTQRKLRASFVAVPDAASILTLQAPADDAVVLRKHVIARGVSAKGEPVGETRDPDGDDRVFYVMRYDGAEPGMAIDVRWWGGTTEIKTARTEIVLPSAAGWANAWLQAQGGLPPGGYQVIVTTSGGAQELARGQFTVR